MSKIKAAIVREMHKPARVNYARRRTIIKGFDDLWQADLAEFGLYARENKGYKFILVVIDCFSKYLWTAPLKDKTGNSVCNALEAIFKKDKRIPKNLQTDNGKEFYNSNVGGLLKKHAINHYSTYTIMKAAMAERVIRTLKDKLYRSFSLRGEYKWDDILDEVTAEYNSKKHSVTGMSPRDVSKKDEAQLLNGVYSHLKMASVRKFKEGDVVRISKQKAVFEKGYTPSWSTELFKIRSVKITDPTTYLLEDMQGDPISGAFYTEELQRTKHSDVYLVEKVLKRSGNKVYVKWLGFPDSHNSWIENMDMV